MSQHDFDLARTLSPHRFSALVMAALLRADERQAARLRAAFPEIHAELEQRRQSRDGRTPAESAFDSLELPLGTRRESS